MKKDQESRRRFIYLLGGGGLAVAAYPVIYALSQTSERQQQQGTHAPTPGDMLGPFYKKGAPLKEKLNGPNDSGTPLLVAGRVVNTTGQPLPDASIEIFHADNSGNYDLQGFRFRGQVRARQAGEYRFETIVPGGYGGRPQHIHYVVSAPGHRTLVTQLYFANDPFFGGRADENYQSAGVADRELIRPITEVGHSNLRQTSVSFDLYLEKS